MTLGWQLTKQDIPLLLEMIWQCNLYVHSTSGDLRKNPERLKQYVSAFGELPEVHPDDMQLECCVYGDAGLLRIGLTMQDDGNYACSLSMDREASRTVESAAATLQGLFSTQFTSL